MQIGKDVDKTLWRGTSGATVNAYYNRVYNQMVFPAAILQNPFFDPSFPIAANFGSMGHEVTHGFDSGGRLYDADGNQNDWWTDSAGKEFEARADCMRAQYSSFEVVGEAGSVIAQVDGNRTIGENIADNGGIKLAYRAYHAYMRDHQQRRLQQQKQQGPKKNLCHEATLSPAPTAVTGDAQTSVQKSTLPAFSGNDGCPAPAGGASPAAGEGGNAHHTGLPAPRGGANNGQAGASASSKRGNPGHNSTITSKGGHASQYTPSPSTTAKKPVNGSSFNGSVVFPTATPTIKPASTTPMPASTTGGNTDKVFFVAYAQTWCSKYRDEALQHQVATGVHLPGIWRANGVVMNSEEFSKTFQCAANKPMNPTKKCRVW